MIKTDNGLLTAKLTLRRQMLDKYHSDQKNIRVLNCCAGKREIWRRLESEYNVEYFGIDRKGGPGLIKMDSVRFLREQSLLYDVIDIDTYGSPWGHYLSFLRNPVKADRATVFLTLGASGKGGSSKASNNALHMIGIPLTWPTPATLLSKAAWEYVNYCLAACYDYDMIPKDIIECTEVKRATRYYGVRLEKKGIK